MASCPLLVLLDDLHWADPDSLGLLGFLCRRLAGWRLAVVATMRPWPSEAQGVAEALSSQGRATTYGLEPLGRCAAYEVLSEAAGRELSEDERGHALEACAGNPFLLAQSGFALRSRSERSAAPAGRDRRLLVSRFGGLSSDVLRLAQVASVVGTRFRPSLVAAVAKVDQSATEGAVRALVTTGLVRELGDGQVEFVHSLFAKALYDDLPETARDQLHGQVMRALMATGADPALAAAHAREGHLMGDRDAVAVLETAGRAALSVGGIASALVDLRAAVDIAGTNASQPQLLTLADTEVAAGNGERAEALCRRLLAAGPEPLGRAQVLTILARAAIVTGRPDEFGKHFEAAAEAAHEDPALEVAILGEAITTLAVMSDPRQVVTWAERARRVLDDHPGMDRTATDVGWANTASVAGDPTAIRTVLDSLADGRLMAAIAGGPPMLAVWTAVAACPVATITERFAESKQIFDAGWSRAQQVGAPMLITAMGIDYADILCRQGRLEDARRLVRSIEEANSGLVAGLSAITALPKALVALETGDSPGAAAECDLLTGALLQHFPDYYPVQRIWLWKLQAELALGAGRTDEATSRADAIRGLAQQAGVVEPCAVPWADTAMAAYFRAGRLDGVEGLVGHLETVSAAWPCRWPRSVAERGRAGLAEVRMEYHEAEDRHHRAIDLLEEVELPLALVRALLGFGTFLRRTGRPTQARAPLGRAIEKAGVCGATRLQSQALAELHASGGRRGRGRSPELSYQEQRTAALAAQGATNAEIAAALSVSTKTVEHYLTSIFAKLGIRSRHELLKRNITEN